LVKSQIFALTKK